MSATSTTEDRLAEYREKVRDGRTLLLVAQSERSRYGYQPPINNRDWGTCIERLGRMAKTSPRLAQVASHLLGKINLYGTDGDVRARIYEEAFHAMKGKFDDVIGRAGPEAGRYSDHQHEWTLYDRVAVMVWLDYATRPFQSTAPGLGWALADLAREVRFNIPQEMEVKRA